jgi:hypothetical protein
MSPTEEKCWEYLLKNRQATAADVSIACGVGLDYAESLMARISSENWREEVATAEVEPERVRLLKRGIELTSGDRNKTYGPPWDNLTACAMLWQAYLVAKHGGKTVDSVQFEINAEDVAHMMQLVKMTRTFHGPYHADNYLDNAVYGAIAGECRQQEEWY